MIRAVTVDLFVGGKSMDKRKILQEAKMLIGVIAFSFVSMTSVDVHANGLGEERENVILLAKNDEKVNNGKGNGKDKKNKQDAEPTAKPEPTPTAKPEPTPTVKPEPTPSDANIVVHKIREQKEDLHIIPDKYNTGAKGTLEKVIAGEYVEGMKLKTSEAGAKGVLDFYYTNQNVSGVILLENYDFSDFDFVTYNEDKANRNIRLIFKNCKFKGVHKGYDNANVTYEFIDCSICWFKGGNAKFERCSFGGSYTDGLVPFQNVEVRDCYFSDMDHPCTTGKIVHTDGTQIYGYAGIDVVNVSYENCRFEIPLIRHADSTATINACIMLQMEYSNANGIAIRDCILNGGGFTIYARGKNDTCSLENILFENIRIGAGKAFGNIYSDVNPNVVFRNMQETDSLYVSSVWKGEDNTHIIVSNDTAVERKLKVYTDCGEYEFVIKAGPSKEGNSIESVLDLPADIDIVIPKKCGYIVCYDETYKAFGRQIRFVNWTDEEVVVEEKSSNEQNQKEAIILDTGACGKNATYTFYDDGTMVIEGEGLVDNYHSLKFPPWTEYMGQIKKVIFMDGITSVGNMMFKNASSLSEVYLPEGILYIGNRSFGGCGSLAMVKLPKSIEAFSPCGFIGTFVQTVYCTEIQKELMIANSVMPVFAQYVIEE